MSSYHNQIIKIYTNLKLSRLRKYIDRASHSNIYFVSLDLSRNHEFQTLKEIRYKDSFGHIFLFTLHTNLLKILFTYKLCVLDYLDQHSYKEKYKETIKENIDFILNNQF